jgi:peptidoglycan/LPS O-acetylase OafA/YrhL
MPGNASVSTKNLNAKERAGYLPTLDGWRAIAIIAIIFHHEFRYSWGPIGTGWLNEHGRNGVDLFFAISGLLICWRLLEEESAFGHISLPKFYLRRAFRILPAALGYLGVIALLVFTGVLHIGLREWLGAVFFFRNYTSLLGPMHPDSWFIGHFWSLAVEEHFYLILPAVLFFTKNRWRIPVLLAVVLVVEFHRIQEFQARDLREVSFHTGIRLNQLLIPAILAVLAQSSRIRDLMKNWLRFWPVILIVVLTLITIWDGQYWQSTLISLLMPMILLGTVLNPLGLLAKSLEWAPLRYVGRLSYSLYLWQQLFFTGHFYVGFPLGILQSTPLRFVATLAIAMASYHFLERPMVKLGHRLAPPATPGRDDVSEDVQDSESPEDRTTPPNRVRLAGVSTPAD